MTEVGTLLTNLSANFVTPINKNMNATNNCTAIIAWMRCGPFSNPLMNAKVNGSVGVIQPGTTGSPSQP